MTGSAPSSIASCGFSIKATHQAKRRCFASIGRAESAAKPCAGGRSSQAVSSAASRAVSSRSAGVPARSLSVLRSGVSVARRSSGRLR